MQSESTKVLGIPAISFIGAQIFYERYSALDDPIYRKDHAWFASHPRQSRFVRPACGAEFHHADAHLDYFGKRIAPPRLWVCVEKRFLGRDHVVTPVYRGSCFWPCDKHDFMLADNSNDETDDNFTVDSLLFQMHQQNGINLLEMVAYATRMAEVQYAVENGPVH